MKNSPCESQQGGWKICRGVGETTAVSGGFERLVSVNRIVGRVGSCCPSVSTASAWTRNPPPSVGAGTVADQAVDVPPGLPSAAGICWNTFDQVCVSASHQRPVAVFLIAT